jgi:hypothetical protein
VRALEAGRMEAGPEGLEALAVDVLHASLAHYILLVVFCCGDSDCALSKETRKRESARERSHQI